MSDSFQFPLDQHGNVQDISTQLLCQTLSFNTDFNRAGSELTTESFSDQGQETSHNSPLKTIEETKYKLPPFKSTFLKKISLDVIPSTSNNESYEVPNLSEDFQFANQAVCTGNAAQNSNVSRHSYSDLIDVSNIIEPANLLEISQVSQQKESPVNASLTLQMAAEVKTRTKFSIKSGIAIENPLNDVLEPEVISISRKKENICPNCGNDLTPKTKMDQGNVVLDDCICKRKVISQSTSNRAMLTHTDVTSVSDPSHSQLFISNKKHKNLIKNSNLYGKKLIDERNTCTNNVPEVAISTDTQHHKHSEVPRKPYVKKHPRVNSSYITSKDIPGNSSRENLESEVVSSSELKKHICQECEKAFSKKSELDIHKVVHTGEKPFACDICQKSYTQKRGLYTHKRIKHPETFQMSRPNTRVRSSRDIPGNTSRKDMKFKRHICLECGEDFIFKSLLKSHSIIHSGEKPFVCDICQKAYSRKGDLNIHKKTHQPETFKVPRVNSGFITSGDMPGNSSNEFLESEVASSSELKLHICQECGKAFKIKSLLIRHSVAHTVEKPFACDICKTSYSRKDNLIKHKKTHHPETFQTPRKSSSFITSGDMPGNSSREDLEVKVASSSELKRHICPECGKDFMYKSDLKTHSFVHTGEKSFVCDICQKSYKRKSSLNEHKRIHHPETFQMPKANTSRHKPGNSSSENL